MVQIRQKGANGEREVADAMNAVVVRVLNALNIPVPEVPVVQRNQNQSAVGGSDLSGTFGMAIEIKRHESLAINTWWEQCTAAAARNGDIPVLIFRQSRQKWRVIMPVFMAIQDGRTFHGEQTYVTTRGEISFDSFLRYFELWITEKFSRGEFRV